ncbi:alcohol oxidase-like protein [Pestalotiopsis sp. NC0098]|nr:alcohol oxidase-like protein [Pestalotiopsis sp. NC0098]
MGLYTKLPGNVEEVDVIVAGGGTAGCVVAGRLAQAGVSVLVIESGPNNYNDPSIIHPLMFITHYLPKNKMTKFYLGEKEQQLGGRQLFEPVGSVLGGGSSINMMVYSRAQRSDYDEWNMPGWSADEMLPYLNKLESYFGPGDEARHGHDGPMQVTSGPFNVPRCEDDFIAAAKKVGYNELQTLYDLDVTDGVQRAMRFIGPDGKRQDTAHRYIHPLLQDGKHDNLHVVVESEVVRVIFDDNKRAVGVEYRARNSDGPVRTVKAKKQVVVSCGVFGTPQVLERSGVGHADVLRKAGIDNIVAENAGVGENFNDHNMILYPYKSSLTPEETVDSVQAGRVTLEHLLETKDKVMGWNAQDIHGKIRPSDSDIASLSPAFQKVWDRDFKNVPSKPVSVMATIGGFPGDPATLAPMQYLGVSTFILHPYSRGHIHITGPKPGDAIDFKADLFTDPENLDMEMMKWTYKKQREIVRRMSVFRGELPAGHPLFSTGSKAALSGVDKPEGLDGPLPADINNIEYSAEDDAVLEAWLKETVGLSWHPLGTCKMAPREKAGAVDASLSVYGVERLKVVDLSIVPGSVSANPMNTACAIGERAADVILGELGKT